MIYSLKFLSTIFKFKTYILHIFQLNGKHEHKLKLVYTITLLLIVGGGEDGNFLFHYGKINGEVLNLGCNFQVNGKKNIVLKHFFSCSFVNIFFCILCAVS